MNGILSTDLFFRRSVIQMKSCNCTITGREEQFAAVITSHFSEASTVFMFACSIWMIIANVLMITSIVKAGKTKYGTYCCIMSLSILQILASLLIPCLRTPYAFNKLYSSEKFCTLNMTIMFYMNTLSLSHLMALASDRLIIFTYSLQHEKWCSVRRWKYLIVPLTWSIPTLLYVIFLMTSITINCSKSERSEHVFLSVLSYFYVFWILIITYMIFLTNRMAKRQEKILIDVGNTFELPRFQKERNLFITVILIVFLHFLFTLPYTVSLIFVSHVIDDKNSLKYTIPLSHLSFGVNIFIFAFYSNAIKKSLRKLLCPQQKSEGVPFSSKVTQDPTSSMDPGIMCKGNPIKGGF